MPCVCGNEASTEECCGAIIKGERQAKTAEELMRSRYAAYVLGEIDHVLATHHPDKADEVDEEGASQWSKGAEWAGLTIHDTEGEADDDTGMVEFTAAYEVRGKLHKHRERAEFRKKDGKWLYYDGEMVKPAPMRREGPKIGRNDPCSCGSGKKYKKCCGL